MDFSEKFGSIQGLIQDFVGLVTKLDGKSGELDKTPQGINRDAGFFEKQKEMTDIVSAGTFLSEPGEPRLEGFFNALLSMKAKNFPGKRLRIAHVTQRQQVAAGSGEQQTRNFIVGHKLRSPPATPEQSHVR